MPKCSICGNTIERLPHWLDIVDVKFRCGKCPDTSAGAMLTVDAEQEGEDEDVAEEQLDGETMAEIDAEIKEEDQEPDSDEETEEL